MESFYGGKQGYSFIFRPNLAREDDGYFLDLGQPTDTANEQDTIWGAIKRSELLPGDYALITQLDNTFTEDHGKFYRISETKKPILIGKIGNMCSKYPIQWYDHASVPNSITNETLHEVDISFLDADESQVTSTIKAYWFLGGTPEQPHIGISLKMPRPVIERSSASTNNLFFPAQGSVSNDVDAPFHIYLQDTYPSDTVITKKIDFSNSQKLNARVGDVWLEVNSLQDGFGRGKNVYTFDLLNEWDNNYAYGPPIVTVGTVEFGPAPGVETHKALRFDLNRTSCHNQIGDIIHGATKFMVNVTFSESRYNGILTMFEIEESPGNFLNGSINSPKGYAFSGSSTYGLHNSLPILYLTYGGKKNDAYEDSTTGYLAQERLDSLREIITKMNLQISID